MSKKTDSSKGDAVNRSAAIREYLAANPNAPSKTVVAALAEKGIKVAPTLVYFIKSKQSHAKRRAKRAKVAESSKLTPSKNPVEVVRQVKDLAREVGGIKNLKMLVDILAE
jgi:hypothetical protein